MASRKGYSFVIDSEETEPVIIEEDIELNHAEKQMLASIIRAMSYELRMSNAAIGRRFGMPRETVRDIVNGKTWKVVIVDADAADSDSATG